MLAYKFYLRDKEKNGFVHVGVLPERRKNPERITDESIMKWGKEYFSKNAKNEDIFFTETFLEDSEKGFFLPLSDQGLKMTQLMTKAGSPSKKNCEYRDLTLQQVSSDLVLSSFRPNGVNFN